MKAVVQRVLSGKVMIGSDFGSSIGEGLLVYAGFAPSDSINDLEKISKKIISLRIFENEESKFDRSVSDINGEILIIPQFTLFGNCSKGNRPDFLDACKPHEARILYEKFLNCLKKIHPEAKIKNGVFGAHMKIDSINNGPVTLLLDSTEL